MTLEDIIKYFRENPNSLKSFKCDLTRTEFVEIAMEGGFLRVFNHEIGAVPEMVAILDLDDWEELE